jgi:diacylglycerol kinase (ATP)
VKEFTFIVNTKAGHGRGGRILPKLKAELLRRGVSFEIVVSEWAGHAQELAKSATGNIVVGVGGDGTINEIVNGLIDTGRTLAVIPAGSGNDLVRSLHISSDPTKALDQALHGMGKEIDVGFVRCTTNGALDNASGPRGRYFVNGVGIGFDAAVAERTYHIKYMSGTALYIAAVLQTLVGYKCPTFQISLDSFSSITKYLLIAVGNGRSAGGGFFLTPDAKLDDGLLDVCLIDEMPVLQILRLIPQVIRGNHHKVKGVRLFKSSKISVIAEEPFHVHADGEIAGRNVSLVEISVVSKRLRVIRN